jgi:DNA-binding MarR family transcriptional regulator
MDKTDIDKIRAFNRFYTRVLGLLDKYLLNSPYTLPEVRVMYEIYHHPKITSKEITDRLGMDKGYLSRMLLAFQKKGLIQKRTLEDDGRAQGIFLTRTGEKEFLEVNKATDHQVMNLLSKLKKQETRELIHHMEGIQKILFDINNDTELPA